MTADLGLIDTNVFILMERLDSARLPTATAISAVTLAELSVGPLTATDVGEQTRRQQRLQLAEAAYDPLPFDAKAARAFASVAASLRAAGRKPAARAFDALIAATALANGLDLYTCNPADYGGIDGLTVVAVPHPDEPTAAGAPPPP